MKSWGADFKAWLAQPLQDMPNLSARDVFLMTGLFVVSLIVWNIILSHLLEAVADA
jgi:hypothetical protein